MRFRSDHIRLLLKYVVPQGWRVLLLTLLLIGGVGLQLLNPQLVRRFLDTAEEGGSLQQLTYTAVLFVAIALLAQIVRLIAAYLGEVVAWTATNALRADLAEHCLHLDLSFHQRHKPGELIERVDGDVSLLSTFFSHVVIQLGTNLLLIAGVMVLLFREDWRIGATMTSIVAAGLLVLRYASPIVIPRWEQLRQVESELFGDIEEWLGGTEEIQTCGAGPTIMRRLFGGLRRRWRSRQSAFRVNILISGVPVVLPTLAYIAAYLWGTNLYLGGMMTIGGLFLVFYYIDVVREPLWSIQRQFDDLQRATAGVRRIAKLFAQHPSILAGAELPLPDGPLDVRFESVTFAYDDRDAQPALSDVTFELARGQTLGVLGRTGSGKTTLARLLCRFYDPQAGRILLRGDGGADLGLADVEMPALRRRIGFVTQDVQLLNASVRDNLTFFDASVTDERLLHALEELGMLEWLERLPDGLDTELHGSEGLSAGEAQLLGLARVFLSDPGVVVLDEASSKLDPATERLVDRAVGRLADKRTMVIIAHRLATVRRADALLILSDGKVTEHGARSDLVADPSSHFRRLLAVGLEDALA